MPGTPGFSGKDSSSSSSAEPPRVLISEVGAPKPKVKAKAAVKKGFLHSKEGKGAPRLYDDSGSTGDGSKEVNLSGVHRRRFWSLLSIIFTQSFPCFFRLRLSNVLSGKLFSAHVQVQCR